MTSGPYRLTRNPGYLGMALVYTGIALLAGALWTLVALIPGAGCHRPRRDRTGGALLEAKFGRDYLAYKAQVRRWL